MKVKLKINQADRPLQSQPRRFYLCEVRQHQINVQNHVFQRSKCNNTFRQRVITDNSLFRGQKFLFEFRLNPRHHARSDLTGRAVLLRRPDLGCAATQPYRF
jgi:hypothetical protein